MKLIALGIALLVITGCVSSTELFDVATQCNQTHPDTSAEDCSEEWAAWDKADARLQARRARDERMKCPEGQVAFCSDHTCSSRARRNTPPTCLNKQDYTRMLDDLRRQMGQ